MPRGVRAGSRQVALQSVSSIDMVGYRYVGLPVAAEIQVIAAVANGERRHPAPNRHVKQQENDRESDRNDYLKSFLSSLEVLVLTAPLDKRGSGQFDLRRNPFHGLFYKRPEVAFSHVGRDDHQSASLFPANLRETIHHTELGNRA